MLILGLTGGIATGKSTVSTMLSAPPFSFPIIDADKIAREVVEPGTRAYNKIVAYFGPKIPDLLLDAPPSSSENGGRPLNRPALGRHVFANETDRKMLNAFTHPEVRKAIFRRLLVNWLVRGSDVVVLDVPLLFEAKFDVFCGATLVVACTPENQRARLLKRDGHVLTEQDAEQRIAAQMPVEKKAWLADVVVWNDGDVDELRYEVAQAVAKLRPSRVRAWLERVPPIGAFMALLMLARNYFSDQKKRREKLT
ncbi:putative dephospho-CoA kinase [Myxozyma melibiosi]|uniref:Dephospho-CoA kinase n=1 Tax=Myxozyma melibiosi TaxID=54550 RepID=A0ABR1F8W7_9ASCO